MSRKHNYYNLASKMLSELSDRENTIHTILDIDTMEQAIEIAKTDGLQLNGPRRQQKHVIFDI
jgi:cell division protein FtsL